MAYCSEEIHNLIIALRKVNHNISKKNVKGTRGSIISCRLGRIKSIDDNGHKFRGEQQSVHDILNTLMYIILSVREFNNVIKVTFYVEEFSYVSEYHGRLEDPNFLTGLAEKFELYLIGLRDIYNCELCHC